MKTRVRFLVAISAPIALASLITSPAYAYVGPGLGLGVIGAIVGAIATFFMVIAGLVWYPMKVMLRKRREKKEAASGAAPSDLATAGAGETVAPTASETEVGPAQ